MSGEGLECELLQLPFASKPHASRLAATGCVSGLLRLKKGYQGMPKTLLNLNIC